MKISAILIVIIILFFGATSNAKSGDLLNINFGTNYSGRALYGNASDMWNNLGTSSLVGLTGSQKIAYELKDSEGNNYGKIIRWNSKGYTVISPENTDFTGTAMNHLMNTYIHAGSDKNRELKISGLNEGEYYLFIYSQGENNGERSELKINANGVSGKTTDSSGLYSTFQEGKNYIKMSINITPDGILSLTYGSQSSDAAINGIQLVNKSGWQDDDAPAAPNPESDTIIMFGIGGIFIAVYNRKKYNILTSL